MAARKKGRKKRKGGARKKGRTRRSGTTRKKGARKKGKSRKGKGHIPLDVLEKRARKLNRIVTSRGGSV